MKYRLNLLLIAIIIIIILIFAIALFCILPNMMCVLRSVPHKNADLQIKALVDSSSLLRLDIGRFPSTGEGLSSLVTCPRSMNCSLWSGPYIKYIPKDPWMNNYQYALNSKTKYLHIYSFGVDGKSSSNGNDTDDINHWDKDKKWINYYEQEKRFDEILNTLFCIALLLLVATMIYEFVKIRKMKKETWLKLKE